MTAVDRTQNLSSLLRSLKSAYAPVEAKPREPVDELVYSMLLWQSTTAKAERALRRVNEAAADVNELRVFRPEHLALVLGERYPLVEERCRRLVCVLNEVYKRAHEVSLGWVASMPKRDARKALDGIDGMPAYVSARLTLLSLGGHAIPVEERMLPGLIGEGVLDEESGSDPVRASAVLERMVKAADGGSVSALLQAWSEDGAPSPVQGGGVGRSAGVKKKAPGTRKKTKRQTTK